MKMSEVQIKSAGTYLRGLAGKAITGNSESVGEDGGYTVALGIQQGVMDAVDAESILWDESNKITITQGNGLKVPYDNDPLAANPTLGARAYWVDEGNTATISKVQVGAAEITLGKLVVRIPVTDELLEDVANLGEYVIKQGTRAVVYRIQKDAFMGFSDSAVNGKIKGVAGDGDKASRFVYLSGSVVTDAEIKTMVQCLHPSAYKTSKWYVTPQQFVSILGINFTSQNVLQFANGLYYLYGMPIIPSAELTATHFPTILGNFRAYTFVMRKLKVRESDNFRFNYGEHEFRIEMRIGGAPNAEVSLLDDGEYYGQFVVAETPADFHGTGEYPEGFQGVQGYDGFQGSGEYV